MVKSVLPVLVVAAVVLAGCSAPAAEAEAEFSPRSTVTQTPTPTPTAIPSIAAVAPAPPPPAPVTAPAPAPAQIDYFSPVVNRWGGCFSRLGVGDLYYDSLSSTVTGAWKGGALTWAVGPGNASGTPADQQSIDALAGC